MDESELKKLAFKYLNFNVRFACWNAKYLENLFNTNGKGDKELSQRQFAILLVVSESGIDTISALEEQFHISKSSLSLTIKKMEETGYVSKKQFDSDNDGRIFHIVLTEKGLDVLNKVREMLCRSFIGFANSLEPNERDKFFQYIDVLESFKA